MKGMVAVWLVVYAATLTLEIADGVRQIALWWGSLGLATVFAAGVAII